MTSISEIFRTFSPEYMDRFGDSIPKDHLKTITAINQCGTEAAGIAAPSA